MKVGLVGYAQSGKTTLFNALTGLCAQTGTGRRAGPANIGVIKVPDARVRCLADIFKPRKTTFAEVVFVDVRGPTGKGGGLDSATLQALHEVDALALVVRGYPRPGGAPPDPMTELLDFDTELVLCDFGIVERRLERLRKERSASRERSVLEHCFGALDAGQALRGLELSVQDAQAISAYSLLSRRPLLAVLNLGESEPGAGALAGWPQVCEQRQILALDVCAILEAEIARLPPEEQAEFLESLGIHEPASARIVRAAYALLDCISFFTVGEDEVRAWTTRRGDRASRAAGRIHSDLERGFIRAEVMPYEEFIQAGSEAQMKKLGKLRVEGKDYPVCDGDILHVRFNV